MPRRRRYRAGQFIVAAAEPLPLPELPPAGDAHVTIARGRPDGEVERYQFREGEPEVWIRRDGSEIRCDAPPSVATDAFLITHAVAVALARRFSVARLGGSAVADERGATAWIGPSGGGKTTRLMGAVAAGAAGLGDDVLLISGGGTQPRVYPHSPFVELRRAAAPASAPERAGGGKWIGRLDRPGPRSCRSQPVPLRRILLLDERHEPRSEPEPLSGAAAVVAVSRALCVDAALEPAEAERARLEQATAIAARVLVYRVPGCGQAEELAAPPSTETAAPVLR